MAKEDEVKELEDEFSDEDTQKNKYLTFSLGDEDYAFEIKYVTEIIGIQNITEVPDMPEYIKGVINLRGKVIPVVDVRLRFGFEFKEYIDRTCVIVVDINEHVVGLIVDEVAEVISILPEQIDPPPKTSKGAKSKYILGMGKLENEVKIILNLEQLLNREDLKELESISK